MSDYEELLLLQEEYDLLLKLYAETLKFIKAKNLAEEHKLMTNKILAEEKTLQ